MEAQARLLHFLYNTNKAESDVSLPFVQLVNAVGTITEQDYRDWIAKNMGQASETKH